MLFSLLLNKLQLSTLFHKKFDDMQMPDANNLGSEVNIMVAKVDEVTLYQTLFV